MQVQRCRIYSDYTGNTLPVRLKQLADHTNAHSELTSSRLQQLIKQKLWASRCSVPKNKNNNLISLIQLKHKNTHKPLLVQTKNVENQPKRPRKMLFDQFFQYYQKTEHKHPQQTHVQSKDKKDKENFRPYRQIQMCEGRQLKTEHKTPENRTVFSRQRARVVSRESVRSRAVTAIKRRTVQQKVSNWSFGVVDKWQTKDENDSHCLQLLMSRQSNL